MDRQALELSLKGFGAPSGEVRVELSVLDGRERMKRALLAFGLCVLAALVALPIPLVHFVLVPTALVAGVALAALRLRQARVFRSVEGRCPLCGTEQRFEVMGSFRLPKILHCGSCSRELQLTT